MSMLGPSYQPHAGDVEVDKPGSADHGRAGRIAKATPRGLLPPTYEVDFHGEGVGEYEHHELKPVAPRVPPGMQSGVRG